MVEAVIFSFVYRSTEENKECNPPLGPEIVPFQNNRYLVSIGYIIHCDEKLFRGKRPQLVSTSGISGDRVPSWYRRGIMVLPWSLSCMEPTLRNLSVPRTARGPRASYPPYAAHTGTYVHAPQKRPHRLPIEWNDHAVPSSVHAYMYHYEYEHMQVYRKVSNSSVD